MRSWLSTSKLLKTTSFILLVILTMCIVCPKGQAIADDDNYPDHENNISPYVHSIIALFDNSPTTGHCTVQDIEFWSNGNSLGYADNLYNISVPSAADCVDVDIQIPIAAPSGNTVICLFNLYALGITNVDYIEFYKQTTYEAVPVYYYTYYSNQFFWITPGQNISASAYYTLRIHIKQGGYTITRYNYANTVTLKSYEPTNNSSFQEQYTQWYFLTSLLREVDGLGFSVNNLSVDFSDLDTAAQSIITILKSMRYGKDCYISINPNNNVVGSYFTINSNGSINTRNYIYAAQNDNISLSSDFIIQYDFTMNNHTFNFATVYFPLVSVPSNIDSSGMKIYVSTGLSRDNNYVRSSLTFDKRYSDFCFTNITYNSDTQLYYLVVNFYYPYVTFNNSFNEDDYLFFKFTFDSPLSSNLVFLKPTTANKESTYMFTLPFSSQQGYEHTAIAYYDKFYDLLHSIADNTQYVPPPTGSDPETNITNIYDIDVEFNNTIGDISVFESNYQQQLTTYDTQISSNYLIPVSDQYTFTSLNSEFQYLWERMFSYDLDENNNKIGVFGLGLYFLIPLVLFVICALFRRVTS